MSVLTLSIVAVGLAGLSLVGVLALAWDRRRMVKRYWLYDSWNRQAHIKTLGQRIVQQNWDIASLRGRVAAARAKPKEAA